jgi:hypothetical protein
MHEFGTSRKEPRLNMRASAGGQLAATITLWSGLIPSAWRHLATMPIGTIQLGENAKDQIYDITFDDILVDLCLNPP